MYKLILLILLSTLTLANNLFNEKEQNWIRENPNTKIVMINNFQPFSYMENSTHKGFTPELLNKISRISGLKFEIETLKWPEALEKFKKGKADIISEISYSKNREDFTLFTKPYYEIPTFIFSLKNNGYIDNKSLIGKKVAVSKDIFYIGQLKKQGIEVVEFKNSFEKAKALVTGNVDYFLASYTTGIKAVLEQSLNTVEAVDELKDIKKEDLRFGITKNKPLLHSIIEKSLSSIDPNYILHLSNKWILQKENEPDPKTIFSEEELEYINKKKILLASNEFDYEPYDFYKNGQAKGYSVDLLNLLLKNTGLKVKYITKHWEDLLNDLNQGRIDLMHTVYKTPQRENIYNYSIGYSKVINNYIIRKNSNDIQNIEELYGKKVGVTKEWSEEKFFKKYPKIKLVYYNNIEEKLKALASGKIDAFTNSSNVIDYYIKKYGYRTLKISNPVKEQSSKKLDDHYFITLKSDPYLISIINKAYDNLSVEEIDKLNKKWFGTGEEGSPEIFFTREEKEFIQSSRRIKIGSIDSYTPFSFIKNGEKVGFTQDLIDIISQKSGLVFETTGGTWPEVFNKFKNKKIDIISELSYRKERIPFTIYTKPYYQIPVGVFTRESFPSYKGVESLKGKRVGIVKSSYLLDALIDEKEFEIIKMDSRDQCFFALKEGRVDAVLNNSMSYFRLNDLMLGGIKLAGYFIHENVKKEDLRFGIRKEEAVLASIINKTLDSIPFSTITRLQQKWVHNRLPSSKIDLNSEEKRYLKEKKQLTICIDPQRMPFEQYDTNGEHAGMSADYFYLFSKMLNIDFNVIRTDSWEQTLKYAQERKCDIVSLAVETPQRKKYLNFTTAYLKTPLVVATKTDVPFINEIKELKGKRIGISKRYPFKEALKKRYPFIKLEEVKDIEEGLSKVSQGRLFGCFGSLAGISYIFQKNQDTMLKIAAKTDQNLEFAIGVRNDDRTLFNILQKSIDTVSSDEKREIMNKWISIKYEKGLDYDLILKIIGLFFIIVLFFIYKQYLLRQSIKEFSELIDSTMEAIFISRKGICINVNQSAVDIFGYDSKKEIIGKYILDLIAHESKNLVKSKIKQDNAEPYEAIAQRKNHSTFHALLRGHNIKNKNIRISSVVDITPLKQLESQTKLAAMGEMIGNIAHQWRQPLTVISTSASALEVKSELGNISPEEIKIFSKNIIDQTSYLSNTIDDFKNFIKENKEFRQVSIKNVIESTLSLTNATLRDNYIKLLLSLEDDLRINGNKNELKQALINIINNAKDVLKENTKDDEEKIISISTKKIKENTLELKICDNGKGISENVINRVFEPYFTTKHKSLGTGLGLSMADKIIRERHKQMINVSNEEFEYNNKTYYGACFIITFKAE